MALLKVQWCNAHGLCTALTVIKSLRGMYLQTNYRYMLFISGQQAGLIVSQCTYC